MRAETLHSRFLGVVILLVTALGLLVAAPTPRAHDVFESEQPCFARAGAGIETVLGLHNHQTLKLGTVAKTFSHLPALFLGQGPVSLTPAPRQSRLVLDAAQSRPRPYWVDWVDLRI